MRLKKAGYQGIYLPELEIAMDGTHPGAKYTFVTHAHADHMHRNRSVHTYASNPTIQLMKLRGFRGDSTALAFGETLTTDRFSVTLYPAGHILGSAMINIESELGSLLYTGDFRTPPSPATEGFEAPQQADYLITEATFGLPIYRWKSNEELADEIRTFAAESLNVGYTPVFLGYNLGKAQEIMHLLSPLNHPIMIHGAGFKLCSVYDDAGYDLGPYQTYDRATCEGKILVCPSSALANGFASNVKKKRIAYCSGWAALEARRTQLTVDKLIPISDHLDFYELIDFCERLSPKKVYITHSPNPDVVKHYLDEQKINSGFLNLEMESDD
ncbi:ligase-associated DNA damage response exonuclease [soil metagenome]